MTEVPSAAIRARAMYAEGVPVRAILAETGLTHHQLYRWIEGAPSKNGPSLLPPLPQRRIVKRARISEGDRLSVVARIMRSAERQVAEIDRRLGAGSEQSDKDARALAMLARTIRELTAIDAANRAIEQGAGKPRPADDKEVPRDVDELRRSLTRKLEAIIAERDDALPGEADP